MPTSEARIQANRLNAVRSTGPRTEEGKSHSRRNSLKHGLTGAGVVLPEADAAEVARRTLVFAEELMAIGEVGLALTRSAALNSVRMERAADQQTAALTERVRRVEADFIPPDGVDAAEAAKLRAEAVRRAMFDPSPEAMIVRRHEASAERSFFKALKELRLMDQQVEAEANAAKAEEAEARMASFFHAQQAARQSQGSLDSLYARMNMPTVKRPANSAQTVKAEAEVDVPIMVGRGR